MASRTSAVTGHTAGSGHHLAVRGMTHLRETALARKVAVCEVQVMALLGGVAGWNPRNLLVGELSRISCWFEPGRGLSVWHLVVGMNFDARLQRRACGAFG